MEYAPLVARDSASFLAHLTILGKSFQPVRKGSLSLDFVKDNKVVSTFIAEKPLREGIFKLRGYTPVAGTYLLRLHLKSNGLQDTIVVPKAVIYPSVRAAIDANPAKPKDPHKVSFLKEQQWKIPFATMMVQRVKLKDGLRLSGESQALPSSHVKLIAPVSGRVSGMSMELQEGKKLRRGQALLYIEPLLFGGTSLPQLRQAIRTAKAGLRLNLLQLKRSEKMLRARAIGAWKLSQIKLRVSMYRSQLEAAQARLRLFHRTRSRGAGREHAIRVRAPFSGVTLKRFVSNGAFVTQGQPLVELASLRQMRLVAHLPEVYAAQAAKIGSAVYRVGTGKRYLLPKPTSIGAAIDPIKRTLSLFFRVTNSGVLKHGQQLDFRVHLASRYALAVSEDAVVDDQGTPVVFVMTGGESFAKRTVKTGIRDRGWVEILEGLKTGERVISLGAYEVLLDVALKQANAMDHGHAH